MVRPITALLLAVMVAGVIPGLSHADGDGYQQYYRHVGKYPDKVQNTGFAEEANGIAHDEHYWYIANNANTFLVPCPNPPCLVVTQILWKVPVAQELYGIDCDTPGVSCLRNDQIPLGETYHYDHYGDLVAYRSPHDQKYYLLLPIEGGDAGPAIAVFRADDLAYLGFDVLRIDHQDPPTPNNAAGWCAVDPEGYVYTSPDKWSFEDKVVKLFRYSLNWDELGSAPVRLTCLETILLKNEAGLPLPSNEIAGYAQGGEFSPDGKLLYVSSGSTRMSDEEEEYGGIHVFDTLTWRRVTRSHSSEDTFFKYDYNSGWSEYEEPEGLTVWDLDEGRASYQEPGRAPSIEGQLHVLLLQNYVAEDPASGQAVYIYHYTNTVHVDHSYANSPDGTIGRPFKTIGEALTFYNQNEYFDHGHWTGGRIKIHTGSYAEALTISRRVQLAPWGGQATVGLQGRLALTVGGVVNIDSGGTLKIY